MVFSFRLVKKLHFRCLGNSSQGQPVVPAPCKPHWVPVNPGKAVYVRWRVHLKKLVTEPLPFRWLDFDLGFKVFISICHRYGHWDMQVVLAHFLTAYFAAYWGTVCPGRTIKSLFYLIRKLLRHINNRSVFQYISHRLIFQFYETSCSYLWVRFSEPVLDFK